MIKDRLDSFIVTSENRSAFFAIKELAACLKGAGRLAAPLIFLHGPPGSGKSRLVASLLFEVTREVHGSTVVALSAADVRENIPGPGQARRQHREGPPVAAELSDEASAADLLVVEDLQQLPLWSVERLVQVLDQRGASGAATVLTANAGPKHLCYRGERYPARLVSRLDAGLMIALEGLQTPGRKLVLEELARRQQLALAPDAAEWLSVHLTGGVRQLESAVTQLATLAKLGRPVVDVAGLAAHFRAHVDASRPTLERIVAQVAKLFRLKPALLKSPERSRSVLWPRQISMYLGRQLTGLSLGQLGDFFGRRDHTTVLHACRKVAQVVSEDPSLAGTLGHLRAALC